HDGWSGFRGDLCVQFGARYRLVRSPGGSRRQRQVPAPDRRGQRQGTGPLSRLDGQEATPEAWPDLRIHDRPVADRDYDSAGTPAADRTGLGGLPDLLTQFEYGWKQRDGHKVRGGGADGLSRPQISVPHPAAADPVDRLGDATCTTQI